jgi:phage terminase small subunit
MRFVHEYLKDLNAAQACIRAGYSEKGANVTGSQLLAVPSIKAAVNAAIAQRAVRVEVKVDDVVRELMRLASVDVMKAFDSKGRLLSLSRMPEDVRRAIQSIEVEELFEGSGDDRVQIGVLRKVKFWDKKGALELLGKHLQMFTERRPADADEAQASARWKPDDAKALLTELRRRKKERGPNPETEH